MPVVTGGLGSRNSGIQESRNLALVAENLEFCAQILAIVEPESHSVRKLVITDNLDVILRDGYG